MPHPEIGSKVKLIKLEYGLKDYKEFLGQVGTVTKCDRYGKRRFYEVHFEIPKPEILWAYRPEIEVVDYERN